MTPQTFTYDNNGNTTSDDTNDFIYGDNNRLASVELSSTPVAEYVYNGKGERIIKYLTDPIHYYYDQNGQLLAELDENGDTIREYAWIDGQPLAMMIEDVIYNYHNDHLGTPQFMTDDFQGIVWAANYEPFGKANITTSTVTNNLRFPGQYFDDETDLHYNYFRDYDPNTGRYVQSDPIGLKGGMNTYAYALQNPLVYSDPTGEIPALIIPILGAEAAIIAGWSIADHLAWSEFWWREKRRLDELKWICIRTGICDPQEAEDEAFMCTAKATKPIIDGIKESIEEIADPIGRVMRRIIK